MSKPLNIVFMGTPDFAVASLRAIHESEHSVVGVITTADKPAGRGKKMRSSAVKQYAEQEDLTLMQPTNLKAEEFQSDLLALGADLFVVVAFRMLPKAVWSMPRLGTFNVHASLLPDYRGAAPINWAIINGDERSGVTTFFIDEKIDTGEIIGSMSVKIEKDDSAGDLHDKLMILGAVLCVKTIGLISDGKANPQAQKVEDSNELKKAPKIFSEHRKIDWSRPAEEIRNLVRGMSPYPAATSELQNTDIQAVTTKVFELRILETRELDVGHSETDFKSFLKVGTKDFDIEILSMQLPGKRRMEIRDILNGKLIENGAIFS
jgi:methionyl-tRNA formyltransferase